MVNSLQPSASPARPFYFLLTFWGREFQDYLCDFTIPSLLAPGNIPALRVSEKAKFLIATTKQDWRALCANASFQRLQKHLSVEFVACEDTSPPMHKYVRMSRGHALLTEICFRDRATAININPDSIYPDGCIAEAQRLAIDGGKDVVLCAAIRFEMEGVLEEVRSRSMAKDGVLIMPMRVAVSIGLANLHAESLASDWDAPNFGRLHPQHGRSYFLTCCFWRVPREEGVCIITHNWSPFVVNYAVLRDHDSSALDGRALDGDYIFQNFPQRTDSIHVVTDSDSLFLLGLTPKADMLPPEDALWWMQLAVFGEWTKGLILSRTAHDKAIDLYRQRIYQRYVRWHARDLNDRWQPVERKVKRLIESYVRRDIDSPEANCGAVQRRFNELIEQHLH